MNAKDLAATLRFGDHVQGITADAHPFAGYLCADPEPGRTAGGYDATILRLASHPVPGKGGVWAVSAQATLTVLPIDPYVAATIARNLDALRLTTDQYRQVANWCTENGCPPKED
jgi:hypothetical protein